MKKKNKVPGVLIALGAALGIIVNGTFGSPADMLAEVPGNNVPVVADISDEPDGGMQDSDEGSDEKEDEKEKGGLLAKFRKWILNLPWWVRAMIGVPLWAAGYLLRRGISRLFKTVLAPLLLIILRWLLFALILLLVFTVIMKLLFPDMPLSTILSKRNVIGIVLSTAALAVICEFLPKTVPEFKDYVILTEFAGGLLILLFFGILTWQDDRKAYSLAG